MTNIIEAIYEGGLFRPVEKVDLTEGTRVEVRVGRTANMKLLTVFLCQPQGFSLRIVRRSNIAGPHHNPQPEGVRLSTRGAHYVFCAILSFEAWGSSVCLDFGWGIVHSGYHF